jgi:hypothetical protein
VPDQDAVGGRGVQCSPAEAGGTQLPRGDEAALWQGECGQLLSGGLDEPTMVRRPATARRSRDICGQ